MNEDHPPFEIETLLEHSTWVRALALRLVSNPDDADNVVQDAALAALGQSPAEVRSPTAWLRGVVRNLSLQLLRRRHTRLRHESSAAAREALDDSVPSMVERAELHAQLVQLVLDLPEPYCSTILLRFFEEETPQEIARRHNIAVTTVRARIGRALETLRGKLDERHGGQRSGWSLVLVPFAIDASQSTTTATTTSSLFTSVAQSSSVGGSILMHKSIVTACCLAALLIGVGVGRHFGSAPVEDVEAAFAAVSTAQDETNRVREQLTLQEARSRALTESRNELRAAHAELLRKLSELETAHAAAVEQATEEPSAGMDWSTLSAEVAANLELLRKSYSGIKLSKADEALWARIRGELLKLSAEASEASANPFFDFEVFLGLTSALFGESLQLDVRQREHLTEIAEAALTRVPANIDSATTLEKFRARSEVLEELWDGVSAVLSDQQLEDWPIVQELSEEVFGYGGRLRVGADVTPESLARNWAHNLIGAPPSAETLQSVGPIAARYLARGKELLERYAATEADLDALPEPRRADLRAEFVELQVEFQQLVEPHLPEEARQRLFERPPLILRFEFGDRLALYSKRSYF